MVLDRNRKHDALGKRNICGTIEAKFRTANEKK